MKYSFESFLFPAFLKKFAEANAKLSKMGFPLLTLVSSQVRTERRDLRDIFYTDVEVSGISVAKREGNYEHVGTISFKSGVKQVFSTDPALVLSTMELRCDHCQSDRSRVKYFVFRGPEGIVMIGSSCVREYFGIDIEKMLFVYDLGDMADLESEGGSMGLRPWVSLQDTIIALACATNTFRRAWISKAKADESVGSLNRLWATGSATNYFLHPGNEDKGARQLMRDKAAELEPRMTELADAVHAKWDGVQPKNDFEFNIYNAMFAAPGKFNVSFTNIGVVSYAVYKALTAAEEEKPAAYSDEHVGKVGERISATVTVIGSKGYPTQYGYSYLMLFRDEAGHLFKTWASGAVGEMAVGAVLQMKGTVKAHEDYQGKKQTVLTRVAGKEIITEKEKA